MFVVSAHQGGVVFGEPDMGLHEKVGIHSAEGRLLTVKVGVAAFAQTSELEGEGTFALLVNDDVLAIIPALEPEAIF